MLLDPLCLSSVVVRVWNTPALNTYHTAHCEHAARLPLLLLLVHGAAMQLQLQRALGRVPTRTTDQLFYCAAPHLDDDDDVMY